MHRPWIWMAIAAALLLFVSEAFALRCACQTPPRGLMAQLVCEAID